MPFLHRKPNCWNVVRLPACLADVSVYFCLAPAIAAELSALLEEDEEGDETRGTAGSDNEAESEGVAMELTGNTAATAAAPGAGSQDLTPTSRFQYLLWLDLPAWLVQDNCC
jgi:hypothetical protein